MVFQAESLKNIPFSRLRGWKNIKITKKEKNFELLDTLV